jgi:hypothetical protein
MIFQKRVDIFLKDILSRFLTTLVFSVHTITGVRIGEVGFGRIRNA